MIEQLLTYIQDQLATNNFLSGGFVLMLIGAAGALCRKMPGKVYSWLTHRLFMEIEIPMKDEAFLWFDEWLSKHPYSQRRARWLSVRTIRRGRNGVTLHRSDDCKPQIILTPAPGVHWMFWKGHFLIVNRERKETPSTPMSSSTPIDQETFNVSVLTRDRGALIRLIEEARDVVLPAGDTRITIYTPHYGEWSSDIKRKPRPIESVILKQGQIEGLVTDIEKYLGQESWYVERGIPYRRGYMLYGPPGTGKSSAVMAIASHLRLDIAVLNLNEPSYSDSDIRDLLAEVPENCIVLIEDVDCVFTDRKGTSDKDNKVTFSGLLNAIDGVVAGEGRVMFMTSNHPDKLDPALIRPGRCDVKVYVGNADYDQAIRIFDRFFPDAPAPLSNQFASAIDGTVSMATLQGHLLNYCSDSEAAVANIGEVYKTMRRTDESEAPDQSENRDESFVGLQA